MNLKEINEALGHQITGGSEYMWNCWPDARYLDYECEYATASVVFNRKDQVIYEATVEIKNDERPYRWINPQFRQDMLDEADRRNIKSDEAWDDVKWIDLETEEDFIEKSTAIFAGEDFDRRIRLPLDLEEAEMMQLFMLAHEQDVTLNQCVEGILRTVIEQNNEK